MTKEAPRLPVDCEAGRSFALTYGPGHPMNRLYHVRGIVDDIAVCRLWLKHKARWQYVCFDEAFFAANRSLITWRAS